MLLQVFTELSQTKQFKAEVAQQLEEKRKANEPLNKAALEKMMKIYTAENLKYLHSPLSFFIYYYIDV